MKALSNNLFTEVSQHFSTPTFLYDTNIIREQYLTLRELLTPSCELFYSIKANPTLAICQYFNFLGANCEVSSKNELLIALKAGFRAEQIIFVGPAKKAEEIESCIQNKIKSIVCESIEEVYLINSLSEKYQIKMSIMIRVNPDFCILNAPIKMSGVASQFGIEVSQFVLSIEKIQQCEFVILEGIQIYNASRVLDSRSIKENIANILSLAKFLYEKFGIDCQTIDVGGGIGIPYFSNECEINIVELITDINMLFDQYQKIFPATKFIMELGRYFIAESGFLISEVQYVKKNKNKNYCIVDAGMHCHFAATGLGSFVHRNFPMHFVPLDRMVDANQKKLYQVVGPLCTPGDILLKDIELPIVHTGDLIVLLNTGAYGLTASPGRFLSHGSPAEVLYHHEKFYIARRRETNDDILSTNIDLKSIFY